MSIDERVLARFSGENASAYDGRIVRLIPGYASLQALACGLILSGAPDSARVLVVGAGTGAEIAALAADRPAWRFTAVEPSVDMIAQAMRKPPLMDVLEQVDWHPGTLDTLPGAEQHDAAICLLVSHFLPDDGAKESLYRAIRKRLLPGARLVFADLCADLDSPDGESTLRLWAEWSRSMGLPAEAVGARFESIRQEVHFVPERRLLEIVQSAGFAMPTRIAWAIAAGCWAAEAN